MRPVLALPLLAVALAACAPSNPPSETPPPMPAGPGNASAAAPAIDAQALAAAHWRLAEAVDASGNRIDALFPAPDQALQLDFSGDRISISGGCNQMRGRYTLSGDRLAVGAMAQTKKFCGGGALMAADEAIGARFAGPATLAREGDRLVVTTAGGDRLAFDAVPTAQTKYGSEGETIFMEVAPQRVPCHHPLMPTYQCLHVRELTYDQGRKTAAGDWQFLYQNIEGYTHEPGIRNVLRVKRYKVANPPADASSIAYVLDLVVESEAVKP